jgi:hypothetical protein
MRRCARITAALYFFHCNIFKPVPCTAVCGLGWQLQPAHFALVLWIPLSAIGTLVASAAKFATLIAAHHSFLHAS